MAEQVEAAGAVGGRAAGAGAGRAPRSGPPRIARVREGRMLLVPIGPTPLDVVTAHARRDGLTVLAIVAALVHLAGGFGPRAGVPGLVATAVVGAVAAAAVTRRWQLRSGRSRDSLRFDVGVALVGLQAVWALVQATGDVRSDLYPLAYLSAALVVLSPLPRNVGIGLVAGLVAQNALRHTVVGGLATSWHVLLAQSAFLVTFAVLYQLLLAARLWRSREAESVAVDARIAEAEAEASSLRLIVADRSSDDPVQVADAARRLTLASVVEVERGVGSVLEAAHLGLGNHALAYYILSADDKSLSLRDGRCPAGLLEPGPLSSGDGLVGQVLRSGAPVRLAGKLSGVTWYRRAVDVRAVAVVPVVERRPDGEGWVRGVLVADRLDAEPFSERELKLLDEVASQLARAVEAERLVQEFHRTKAAQDRLARAADELNRAASVEEVGETAARLLAELVPDAEIAALTRCDGEGEAVTHVVVACAGTRADEFHGLVYDDNDGLVAHACRIGSPLPARPPGVLERVRVFDLRIAGTGSLRVVPLSSGGKVLGTLVAATKSRGRRDGAERRSVDALASLAAGALSRAVALAEVSAAATTDALTKLANRRRIESFAKQAIDEATRYQRPLSVLVTDVDHFKKVNDTFGHDGGDAILKVVAEALRAEARTTDLAGRWGGEEFVLVLPQTDLQGARELAERIRRRVESLATVTPQGTAKVTLSLGVASLPGHGKGLEALVKAADEALYEAKRAGRNRVVVAP